MLGSERQETLQPGAGMFRTAPFKAVRQQQHQPGQPPPFVLRGGDELIHDHLRGIPEVAELCLPPNECIGVIETVPILETEHTCLRQWTVIDFDGRLVRRQVLQRVILLSILDIV